jgi:hypothetical protein
MKTSLLFALAALAACGGGSAPAPVLTQVNGGDAVVAGSTDVEVTGSSFAPGIAMFWNGRAVPTVFKTDTTVEITLDDTLDDRAAGTAVVTARNRGGPVGDPLHVNVVDGALQAVSVSPTDVPPGAAATTITVRGAGFTAGAKVFWNGAALDTALVSGGRLTAVVPAALLAHAGEGIILVGGFAGCPAGCVPALGLPPPIVKLGASTKTAVRGEFEDVVWDATHGRLYAATLSSPNGQLVPLDPATGVVGAAVGPFGPEPPRLAVADGGQFLYAGFFAPSLSVRFTLPDFSAPVSLPAATAVAAAPGAPETFAISTDRAVEVIDVTAPRPNTGNSVLVHTLAWGADASTLYAIDAFQHLVVYHVDASGLSAPTQLATVSTSTTAIHFDATLRLLYTDVGEVFTEQGTAHPLSGVAGGSCTASALDGAGGRFFVACVDDPADGVTVRAFDVATAQELARVLMVPNGSGDVAHPRNLVRWGANGLALTYVATAPDAGMVLYTGAFVH